MFGGIQHHQYPDWFISVLPDGLGTVPALALVAASFFTSALTAALGVGGGLAMLALMGLFLPVAALIPVHGAVQLGSNTGRAWRQRAGIRWPMLWPFLAGAAVGAAAGATVAVELPDAPLKIVLGLFVVAATWMRIPGFDRLSAAGLIVGGGVLSALTMALGATGTLISAFFGQAIHDDRKALVATHAAGMTMLHAFKIVAFGVLGFAFWRWLPLVAAMIGSGYVGTIHGTRLLHALPEKTFRLAFRLLLTVLAVDLVRRGALALV